MSTMATIIAFFLVYTAFALWLRLPTTTLAFRAERLEPKKSWAILEATRTVA